MSSNNTFSTSLDVRRGHEPFWSTYCNRVRCGDSNMENIPDPEITEEIKEELRFMADHLHYDGRIGRDGEYKTIILEEADAYFAGDKTAEEEAELIQNRVSLFLSE